MVFGHIKIRLERYSLHVAELWSGFNRVILQKNLFGKDTSGGNKLIVETKPPNISYISWFETLKNNWLLWENGEIREKKLFEFALERRMRPIIEKLAPKFKETLSSAFSREVGDADFDYLKFLLKNGAQFQNDFLTRLSTNYKALSFLINYNQISPDGLRLLLTKVAEDKNKKLLAFILQLGVNINVFNGFLLGETIRHAVVMAVTRILFNI